MSDRRGHTYYSKKVKGAQGNYDWPVRFDRTDGYIGVNQYDGEALKDRVLLSPAQVRELVKFASLSKGEG